MSARLRRMTAVALADLAYERLLAACLVAALTAILAPLLVLQGLRAGSVELLRARLIENPSFREVWPIATHDLAPAWFAEMRARPDVAFVLPTTLLGLASVNLRRTEARAGETYDLKPTAPGDPVLARAGLEMPGPGEIVLTEAAATALGVGAGNDAVLTVTRWSDGAPESVDAPARIAGIVPFEYDGLARVYAPLDFVRAVARYRRGLAVRELGWSGGARTPAERYDGAFVLAAEPLSERRLTMLRIGTGISRVDHAAPERVRTIVGRGPAAGVAVYELRARTGALQANALRRLEEELRGQVAALAPFVSPGEAKLEGLDLRLVGWPGQPALEPFLEPVPATLRPPPARADGAIPLAAAGGGAAPPRSVAAEFRVGAGSVAAPALLDGRPAAGADLYAPAAVLAMLNQPAGDTPIWDREDGVLAMADSEAKGFRLYAVSIDDAPGLYRELTARGMRVEARVAEIEQLRALDGGLTRLFLAIAAIGAVGGAGAIAASLYATVLRKRRELAVLRLIGFTRRDVWLFPLVQGLTVAGLGFAVSFAVYAGVALLINLGFSDQAGIEGALCALPATDALLAAAALALVACLSALAAARAATQAEPADGIREP